MKPIFDTTSLPVPVARVCLFPMQTALDLLSADDAEAAVLAFYRDHQLARLALTIASPSLMQSVQAWIQTGKAENKKVPLRALSYALRMSTRCTPFGLFAGVARLRLGEPEPLRVGARRTQTRLDMDLVRGCVERAEKGVARHTLKLRTNRCSLVRGDRLYVTDVTRGIFKNTTEQMMRTEQREISLKHTQAVAFVRELCMNGVSYEEARDALCERFGTAPAQSEALLDNLIKGSVVYTELRGTPFSNAVERTLATLERIDFHTVAPIAQSQRDLQQLDAIDPTQRDEQPMFHIDNRLRSAHEGELRSTFAVDSALEVHGSLPPSFLEDARMAAEACLRSGRTLRQERYRRRFLERYEGEERMVPLLELVDPNLGLGVPDTAETDDLDQSRVNRMSDILFAAARDRAEELELDDETFDIFAPPLPEELPTQRSLELYLTIAASDSDAVARGEYRMTVNSIGDYGGRTIGRFASLLGSQTQAELGAVVARSAAPDELLAEFAYMPTAARAFNVCIRPLVTPFCLRAGTGDEVDGQELDPADLYVGIENGRFFVWSRSHQRRVILRETHALITATNAPNVCRFIALIQADGLRGAMFEIAAGDTMPYTPRIRRGRVILHPRTWRFERSIFGETPQSVATAFRTLRDRWDAPRYVLLCDSDNRLLLDLDSPISAEIFLEQSVKGRLEFREVPAMPGELVIGGEGGGHCSELIIQAVREPLTPPERRAVTVVDPRITYGPGSEWAYAKLYIAKPGTDVFLSRDLASFTASLEQRGLIDRCFFLRYADPAPHVRLRLHARENCSHEVHDALLRTIEGWKSSGTISAAALATYDPEYERYNGINGIEAAEAFFDYDSHVCFAALADNLSSSRAQIESAVATFDPIVAASDETSVLVLRVFAEIAKRKMDPGDRDVLRRLTASTQRDETGARLLEHALAGEGAQARLMSLLHMHCNRMGLDYDAERRAATLLRAAALARSARGSAEKSPKEMARI